MRKSTIAVLFCLVALTAATALPPQGTAGAGSFEATKAAAERLVQEKSWKLALEAYETLNLSSLAEEERRWALFRLADLRWRSAPEDGDQTIFEASARALRSLLQDEDGQQIADRVSAEARESLGDMEWTSRNRRNWSGAWQHYAQALDWWAGDVDIEAARERYLNIVWKATDSGSDYQYHSYHASNVPIEILENAARIAVTPEDRSRANYLLAAQLSRRRDPDSIERTRAAFETAIEAGKASPWHDDALMQYAIWLESSGALTFVENGGFRVEPDYETAVAMYRRLLSDYTERESRFWRDARTRLDSITGPSLGLAVSNVFLPRSEIRFNLSYRNVSEVTFSLSRVDLTSDVTQWSSDRQGNFIQAIDASKGRDRSSWTRASQAVRRYVPVNEWVTLERDLPPGAWLLEARAGSETARELILVTQAAVVSRTSGSKTLIWVTDAETGSPFANARVSVWQESSDGGGTTRRDRHTATTDGSGLAEVPLRQAYGSTLNIFASAGEHQAMLSTWSYHRGATPEEWRIYAITDRPAYRPGETVQWKITARVLQNELLTVPGDRTLTYEIRDPRGTSVAKGSMLLNAFGSAWTELPLGPEMTLGEYRVDFTDGNHSVGSATLFRIEEYKLPEYRVEVVTDRERAYRLGDTVEVSIEASYYYGGPVADANVEAIVYQMPYYRVPWRERDYPWFFESQARPSYFRGSGPIVKRETLRTDAEGRARLTFDTPAAGTQDFEYRIEVRVTDASRREITGERTIRVTRAPYFAEIRPDHWIHRPGEKETLDFRTIDPNDEPVSASGTLQITREEWEEVWLDPTGKEVSGRQLEAVRARGTFPPPREPGRHPWTLVRRGYIQERISESTVTTDADGEAEVDFTPAKEGFYRFRWTSRPAGTANPRPRDIVTAETTVWVATDTTTRIGYHVAGGVEILLDQESVRPGATVPVMIVVPTADRHVLFTVEGEEIFSREVLRTSGNVKLVQLQLGDEHIPNVFLTASMVMDLRLHADMEELIVPPVEKFLNIAVQPDREEYLPGDRGALIVTARDVDGNPVQAEVSLSVADESVYAIQEDYAGDPRPFFYGRKRQHHVQVSSSFNRPYVRLVEGAEGHLLDERDAEAKDLRRQEGGVVGGALGGVRGDVEESIVVTAEASAPPAAPPPPPVAQAAPAAKVANAVDADGASQGADPAVIVRSDFRSTVFWKPDIITEADGTARVEVVYPDSLTSWRATARAITADSRVGSGRSATRTKKPLIVRLQAPRFFVVGDEPVVSAVINNNTDGPLTVAPSIDASGLTITGLFVDGQRVKGEAGPVQVAANGEARVDWTVAVNEPGSARVRVTARAGALSDAMERSYPVEEHGIDKLVAVSGKVRGDESVFRLELPDRRRSTVMAVHVTPSLAVTMLDALPYLIDFPYGCTEQTMSRFLPAVVVSKTLNDLGISREVVATRLFGGIESAHVSATHPQGKKNLAQLDAMVRAGLLRLYDFQHGDGGWGWWKEGESDRFMTAYVVWGLALAEDAGVDVRRDALSRGVEFLRAQLVQEEASPDRQAWMLHALSATGNPPTAVERTAIENLWQKRDRLSSYSLALYALAVHQYGDRDRALVLARNLENGVKLDRTPDASILVRGSGSGSDTVMETAHWGARGSWWRWHEGPVESTSMALRALVTIDPGHRLIEPAMNWLVKNRRGAQWNNTRDTAITVLALNEYLRASGELSETSGFDVVVNGKPVASRTLSKQEMFSSPSRFEIPASSVRNGVNEVTVRRTSGSGALYVAAEARFFSLEEPVRAAGNEIFIRREYLEQKGRPTLLKGVVYDDDPLLDGESIQSGERVEVVVTIEVKNDYEYLLIEDLKPAGLEAVELVSGTPLYAQKLDAIAADRRHGERSTTRVGPGGVISTRPVYRELRDRKVALFIDKLEQGIWEIRYTMRAEVPGEFHALPALGGPMYVPEIRGNSDEVRIEVEDRQ